MLNWYEEQIRSAEIERELTHRHLVSEARLAPSAANRRFDRTLVWLGRGLVSVGWRLQGRRAEGDQ